jgi:hypothetical protein
MSEKMDISNDSADNSKGIFWDAFAYISALVSRVWSSGDDSGVASTNADSQLVLQAPAPAPATASAPASTDECKDVFTGITSSINESKYVINIAVNDSGLLKLRLPETLRLAPDDSSFIGLVALSNNELINVPEFNENNQKEISMTQYYRDDSSNNCVIIHLTATTYNTPEKLICERYICVEYDMSGNIIKTNAEGFNARTFNVGTFNNWKELNESPQYNGVVPNPNERSTKEAYKYLFTTAKYKDAVNKSILNNKKSNKVSSSDIQANPLWSVRSPAEAMIKEVGISSRMDDMMKHGVNGLGKAAENRYAGDTSKVEQLNKSGNVQPINEQIRAVDMKDMTKKTCAINDFTDLAHDVRTLQYLDEYIKMVFPRDETQTKELKTALDSLLSSKGNIDVPKSHEIQKKNIKDLETYLRGTANIIIPNIPTEKYESRYEMYVQLIVDLMQHVKRSNYSESGKQITINTFKKFYRDLDDDKKILFCADVQNRIDELTSTSASASSGASAGSDKKSDTFEIMTGTLQEYTQNYPSIPKKCGLDGCETGEIETKTSSEEYIIENIYGLYNFNINGSNKDGWTITITRHDDTKNPKTDLLTWNNIPSNFHIILDDVIWYVNKKIEDKPDFKPLAYRSKNYSPFSHEKEHEKEQKIYTDGIKFYHETNVYEKTLLVFSLKTAMDKLYRISGKELTEIGTIDSYVWGDVYIQYFLGKLDNLLMIYRVSDATGDKEQADEDCEVDTNTLGGRGLVVHPMVQNVYSDKEGILLMKKTLVYANWIQQLANMSPGQSESQSYESQEQGGAYAVEIHKSFNVSGVFGLSNKLIFDTSNNKLGSLIPTNIRMSYRLLNFVERLGLNGDIKIQDNDDYDKTMVELFNTERNNVIERVKDYIPKLQEIMDMELLTDANKSAIRKAIVELPDLEDLLTMSSPSYYVDNEDTLIDMSQLKLDTKFKRINSENSLLYSINEADLVSSSEGSDTETEDSRKKPADKLFLFTNVNFLENGNISITYDASNMLMTKMVQNDNAYKLIKIDDDKSKVITGPITLELLYKLKRYAPNDEIQQNINDKINEIIDAFKNSILGVSPLAGTAMNTEQTDAYTRGYNDGLNGEAHAKSAGGIEDSISRAYDLGFNTGKKIRETLSQSDGLATPTKRKKIGGSDGGRPTRKRNPSKIPRRTIRRGRPKRGQRRTQKRKQKPRRTIRRRNKKGTQKRRK